jgi:phosphoenolpyruvate carboxylase
MLKRIPKIMMTQHPDSASKYVSIQEEPEEAVETLTPPPRGYGIDEVMIDFEGKLTPYHQTVQVVNGLFKIGLVPGRDVFVTPRVASATRETTFKQLMALLSIVETNYFAQEHSSIPAVTEIILPMVENAEEILQARRRIEHVIKLAHDEFGVENNKNAITVIPILEEIPQLIGVKGLLEEYVNLCRKEGFDVSRLRYMLARSDPALSYGLVSAVLACKVAISRGYELASAYDIRVAPILGAGSLPFRGHIVPSNIGNILTEYSGIRTITIQSGLRYDHPKEDVIKMIRFLDERLQATRPLAYTEEEYDLLINLIGIFTRTYIESFSHIIGPVCKISDLMPKQRDRLARKSEVGYARDIVRPEKLAGFVKDRGVREELLKIELNHTIELPRAISYTAALYTIGYPPEFLGVGRGLREVVRRYGEPGLKDLLRYYPGLVSDLKFAGKYLHFKNARKFFPDKCISLLRKDLDDASEILGQDFGPRTEGDELHRTLMETVRPMLKQLIGKGREFVTDREREMGLVTDCIIRMGKIRGSLG